MNYKGLIIGIATFLTIGMFHIIVVKAEYYWGKESWWLFLCLGIVGVVCSLLVKSFILSTISGVFAFSCFWSIGELIKQEKRVQRGWFPKNPKRKK
ncbi:MAG: DUF4491 family protein [Bacteroidales bacterium]|nr:DUF4491 family protein [Candidatus Colimorpha merdihippi]